MSPATEHQDGFGASLETSLERLQHALRTALGQVGVQKPGPTSIGKVLGLDKSIAWKVGRMAKAEHPLQALEYLPGQLGARIVVDAFRTGGLGDEPLEALRSAFEALEQDIERHAGDRATARAMAKAALTGVDEPALDENLRRDHFRTAASVWGAQARVQVKCDFVAPGREPGSVDTAGFEGFVDLLRLRPGIAWRLGRKRVISTQSGITQATFEPLDPQVADAEAPPLMVDHCSEPLPEITSHEDAEGFRNYELEPGRVGRTGSATCLIATRSTDVLHLNPDPPADDPDRLITGVHLRTPSELLVLDFFVHRSIHGGSPPTQGLYGQLKMGPAFPVTGQDQQLPVPFEVERLTMSPGSLTLLEVPGHADAIRDAARMAGLAHGEEHWRLEDFIGYRVRLTYPPIPSIGIIKVDVRHP